MNQQQKRILKHHYPKCVANKWTEVPLSNKNKIRKNKNPNRFSELRITSGSTGNPLFIYYSKESVNKFIKRTTTSLDLSGISKKDVVLNLFAYANYVPGAMYEKACQKMEVGVIPLGSPNMYPKEKVIEVINKTKPTVWLSVPSYAINLLNLLSGSNVNKEVYPKKIIVAGEKLLTSYLKRFQELEINVINHFGLTECPAIGVSMKKHPELISTINDGIYTEIIKKENGNYLVVSDLYNYSSPIIRYETGDIVDNVKFNRNGTLSEFKLVGRADDLIKVQGILVSKAKIIDILSTYTSNFLITIKTKKGRDFVEIKLPVMFTTKKSEIVQKLYFLKNKNFLFTDNINIPKTLSYKNKYFSDIRK